MIVVIIMILLVEIIICPMIIVRSSCYKHLVALDAYIFDYIILQYVHVNLGESVDFICTTDNWRACSFKHADKCCKEIEWWTSLDGAGSSKTGLCDDYTKNRRVGLLPEGDNNLCGLRVTEARAEDSGEWECEYKLPEQYERGGRVVAGDKAKKKFQVVVELPWNTTWEEKQKLENYCGLEDVENDAENNKSSKISASLLAVLMYMCL